MRGELLYYHTHRIANSVISTQLAGILGDVKEIPTVAECFRRDL